MNEETSLLGNGLPVPPIPGRLQELLKDYLGHLERLQAALNTVVDGPTKAKGAPDYIFELATWALEGRLETFIREAQDELEAAMSGGDLETIARAKEKKSVMGFARSLNDGMSDLNEIWSYVEEHKEALK
jgi:hypothetical protein